MNRMPSKKFIGHERGRFPGDFSEFITDFLPPRVHRFLGSLVPTPFRFEKIRTKFLVLFEQKLKVSLLQ
jgi:hypothetical protein